MLVLKLLLAPALIGLATLAARRWGAAAAGWAASLPVVGGPVLLAVALDHSRRFTAHAAAAATSGLVSLALFGLAYARLARRERRWWVVLPGAWAVFGASTLALSHVPADAVVGLAAVVVTSVVVRRLIGPQGAPGPAGRRLPFDLSLRMAAGAVMVLALSSAAAVLGPRLTGLLTPFPVIASVLAAFTQAGEGEPGVRRYADALVRGLPSFAAFTFVISWLVRDLGTATAFLLASAVALASHAVLITIHSRRPHPVAHSPQVALVD